MEVHGQDSRLPPPPAMAQQPLFGQRLLIFATSQSHWHTTLGRAPLDEWSAWRRDLFLTTHAREKTSVSTDGFEPATPASEWPQTRLRPRGYWDRRSRFLPRLIKLLATSAVTIETYLTHSPLLSPLGAPDFRRITDIFSLPEFARLSLWHKPVEDEQKREH
jgi:hypothetical protein